MNENQRTVARCFHAAAKNKSVLGLINGMRLQICHLANLQTQR